MASVWEALITVFQNISSCCKDEWPFRKPNCAGAMEALTKSKVQLKTRLSKTLDTIQRREIGL